VPLPKNSRVMQKIHVEKQSPYSAQQMFDLIVDVDRYHEFIPYCTASRVRAREADGAQGDEVMLADLVIAYKFLRETYSSRVLLSHALLTVTVNQARGPFRHLFNQWRFTPTDDGCLIDFTLDFEFAVPLLRRVIQPIMGRVVEKFVAAFETRAHAIYG
jgi:coenzyme Q-binding protein COQ10